jgi:shikimate dehydrogenase
MVGMNVTVPHKQSVMTWLNELDATARAIGAVNTIEKRNGVLTGHNTDRSGYIRSLREAGCDPRGMNVLVIGYGGAERAVSYSLAEAGVASISIAGRRPDGIAEAAGHLRAHSPAVLPINEVAPGDVPLADACAAADLIVNCTSVGMRHTAMEGASPVPGHMLRAGQWVSDAVYNPLETELLRLARAAGAHPVDGLGWLVYQAADAIEIWTGKQAPVDIMRAAALEAIGLKE